MLVSEQPKVKDQIRQLIGQHGRTRSALLPVLQEIQRTHACVSGFAMQVVADELGIHPAEVYADHPRLTTRTVEGDAELAGLLHLRHQLGRRDQGLTGDTVGDHRGAANAVGVHDGDFGPQLSGDECRLIATRSAADDHHTIHGTHSYVAFSA